MIKVLHFIHGLNTGGAETLVKNYALNINKKKFNIVILCRKHCKGSPYEKMLMNKGIRIIFAEDYLRFRGHYGIIARVCNHFQQYLVIRKLIRREMPDILHTHLNENSFIKFVKPKKQTIIFHTVHSEPKFLWNDSTRNKRDLSAAKWLVKKYNMRFIVLHDVMKKEVDELFNVSNSIVLNNGIDIERFKKHEDKLKKREELGIPRKAFVVGHVGRFSEQKNHKFLVDVFKELSCYDDRFFLLMVGDGRGKNEIINQLSSCGLDNRYLILSNREDVRDIMGVMDYFIFPSLIEGLGIALVEAQVSKLPCFISDKVPGHAIISNLVTRISLDDNAKKWSEKILNYKKPDKIILDEKEWDIKKVTKQLEDIYIDALAEDVNE